MYHTFPIQIDHPCRYGIWCTIHFPSKNWPDCPARWIMVDWFHNSGRKRDPWTSLVLTKVVLGREPNSNEKCRRHIIKIFASITTQKSFDFFHVYIYPVVLTWTSFLFLYLSNKTLEFSMGYRGQIQHRMGLDETPPAPAYLTGHGGRPSHTGGNI